MAPIDVDPVSYSLSIFGSKRPLRFHFRFIQRVFSLRWIKLPKKSLTPVLIPFWIIMNHFWIVESHTATFGNFLFPIKSYNVLIWIKNYGKIFVDYLYKHILLVNKGSRGEMWERFNQHAWKACIVATLSRLKSKAQAKLFNREKYESNFAPHTRHSER